MERARNEVNGEDDEESEIAIVSSYSQSHSNLRLALGPGTMPPAHAVEEEKKESFSSRV